MADLGTALAQQSLHLGHRDAVGAAMTASGSSEHVAQHEVVMNRLVCDGIVCTAPPKSPMKPLALQGCGGSVIRPSPAVLNDISENLNGAVGFLLDRFTSSSISSIYDCMSSHLNGQRSCMGRNRLASCAAKRMRGRSRRLREPNRPCRVSGGDRRASR